MVTGGTEPYTYSVDGSPFTTMLVYSNVAAGSHSLTVKDVNGCTFSVDTTVDSSNRPNCYCNIN